MLRYIASSIFLLLFVSFAHAQSIRWQPEGGTLGFNQQSQLQLVFEDCRQTNSASIPNPRELEMRQGGSSEVFSSANGRIKSTFVQFFAVRPLVQARVTIPSFVIETDKGPITVPAVSYDVGPATVQGTVALDSVVKTTFKIPTTVWAGEVFPLVYSLDASRRYLNSIGTNQPNSKFPAWDPTPLMVEPWPGVDTRDTLVNGEQWCNIDYRSRAMMSTPGEYKLNPATQMVNLTTGASRNQHGFILGGAAIESFTITSNAPSITVKPLPAGAPASFSGAVGKFELISKVVPENAAAGEPVTWTLSLSGTGNWPSIAGLPSRSVSKDFHVVNSQPKRTPGQENALFDATLSEDVVLVPTKAGAYTLAPVEWTYFDPAQGKYVTIKTPSTTINVTASTTSGFPSVAGNGAANGTGQTTGGTDAGALAAAAKLPAGIPRDPLPSAVPVSVPYSWGGLAIWLVVAGVWPLALWLILALLHARRTDPARPQREARARLQKTLQALDQTPSAEHRRVASLMQSWQKDTAVLWKISQVVPSAVLFMQARDQQAGAVWQTLWTESERVIYRTGTPLPSDWSARAHDALVAKRVRGFSLFSIFRLRNLAPFATAALIAVCCVAFAPHMQAAVNATERKSPEELYKAGEFVAAEKAWRAEVKTTPTNWAARYNLSLALGQQDRWAEGGAHALAAYLQNPDEPIVAWNLRLMLSRAGYTPPMIKSFQEAELSQAVVVKYSPSQWQCVLGCSVLLAAMGMAVLLMCLYGYGWRLRKVLVVLACFTFVLALVSGAAAVYSLNAYGPAKDARAVVIWKAGALRSIPTVADTTQKTTPLAAGVIGVVDKEFPGWVRLSFENGQTGWVPKEDVISLWQ